jgi:hypothetical protein
MVGERHFARPRQVPSADQPHVRDGMMRRATRADRDQRRAVAGEAGDAVDARGLDGLSEGHRRPEGGEPPGQHGRGRPSGAEQEEVLVSTPADRSASRLSCEAQRTVRPRPPSRAGRRRPPRLQPPRGTFAIVGGAAAVTCVRILAPHQGHARHRCQRVFAAVSMAAVPIVVLMSAGWCPARGIEA